LVNGRGVEKWNDKISAMESEMNLVIGVGVSLLCCMIVDKAVGDQLFFFEEDEKARCSA
jgi:hypothetical protein